MTVMEHPSLFDAEPRARHSDPVTAHEAANVLKPGNAELVMAIRRYVFQMGPSTSWQIADALVCDRWQYDTIRSAVSRASLTKWPGGTSPGGRPASLYGTTGVTVPTCGRI